MVDDELYKKLKRAFEDNDVYKRETICLKPGNGVDYADLLLLEKLDTVRRYAVGGLLVDLCCGSGEHLFALKDIAAEGIGIDFSENFISHALADARATDGLRFLVGDARAMPIANESVDTLFCFSSLYVIPDVDDVFADIMRVLKPGGRCVLDLGNAHSLNQFVCRAYPEIPPTSMLPIGLIMEMLESVGFLVVERRSFQILPLWADKPGWLWPLLHPGWKRIMKKRIAGKMIDEWVSSLPGLRALAFRHLVVCEKPARTGHLDAAHRIDAAQATI